MHYHSILDGAHEIERATELARLGALWSLAADAKRDAPAAKTALLPGHGTTELAEI